MKTPKGHLRKYIIVDSFGVERCEVRFCDAVGARRYCDKMNEVSVHRSFRVKMIFIKVEGMDEKDE